MPCASPKPSQDFTSTATQLVMRESRPDGLRGGSLEDHREHCNPMDLRGNSTICSRDGSHFGFRFGVYNVFFSQCLQNAWAAFSDWPLWPYFQNCLLGDLWFLFCHESFAWRSACHLFQVLADALSINKTITTLLFSGNQIGDNGMKVSWVERCGASRGSCVKSGWIRAKICGASMEVMGSHRIWSEGLLLNLEPFQDLVL